MPKKGLGDFIHSLVMEDDGDEAPKSAPAAPVAAAPIAAPAASPVMDFSAAIASAAAEPADDKAMALINSKVFGQASSYTIFQKMWETLGKPTDFTVALKALQVTNPAITPVAVLADIQKHLAALDAAEKAAEADFKAAADQRLGAKDAEIKRLTDLNEQAKAEIERHTKETGERIGQIAQLTQDRATDEQKIASTKAKTLAAEAVVRTQLQTQLQVFTALAGAQG